MSRSPASKPTSSDPDGGRRADAGPGSGADLGAGRAHPRLDRYFARFERRLPDRVARTLRRLWHPAAWPVRVPAGLLLIVGGVFGFLPVLGFWMIPLGLILLARDIPLLARPIGAALVRLHRRWPRRRR